MFDQIILKSDLFICRIAAPPGGLQGSFLRMSQGPGPGAGPAPAPGPGLVGQHGGSVQMKRPGEFAGIRPVTAAAGHMMPGQGFS